MFFHHSHYLLHENWQLNEYSRLICHFRFRQGTPKIILAFQVGLSLKKLFTNKKHSALVKRTCWQQF